MSREGNPSRKTWTTDQLWRSLRANRRRVFEIIDTDLLVWQDVGPPRRPQGRVEIEIRRVGRGSASDWHALVPPEERSNVPAFLARDDVGYLAVVDGAFAGWVWRSRQSQRDHYSGLRIRLAPDEAYGYTLRVNEAQRVNGVGAVLMTEMLTDVASDPTLTRLYAWVDKRNRRSQVLLRMLGFTQAQQVRRAHLLRRYGIQLPRSVEPDYGPLSREGRHTAS